jgi:hypothetical protein
MKKFLSVILIALFISLLVQPIQKARADDTATQLGIFAGGIVAAVIGQITINSLTVNKVTTLDLENVGTVYVYHGTTPKATPAPEAVLVYPAPTPFLTIMATPTPQVTPMATPLAAPPP